MNASVEHDQSLHQVDLGQYTDRSSSIGVDISCQLQAIRVCQIGIGRSDGQDDGIGLGDILDQHILNLSFDVSRLVAYGHLGQPGKIDQRQGQDVGREDPQVDGVRGDTLKQMMSAVNSLAWRRNGTDSPAFFPVIFSVSLTISSRILLKSKNFCPGKCKNSPHSSAVLVFEPFSSFSATIISIANESFQYGAYLACPCRFRWACSCQPDE